MKRSLKYSIVSFFTWLSSPIILALLVFFSSGERILNDFFFFDLCLPAFLFSGISYSIGKIKNEKIRYTSFLSILGIFIWASPSIYFLPSSDFYSSLPFLYKLILLFLPAIVFGVLFFLIAFFSFGKRPSSEQI